MELKVSIDIYYNYLYIKGMYYSFFFNYNKIVVIIVSVFSLSVLNVVYSDCDVLVLKDIIIMIVCILVLYWLFMNFYLCRGFKFYIK